MQVRVRQRFEELANADDQEGRVPWHFVSAAQTVEEVQQDINKVVEKTLGKISSGKELGKLWEEGPYQMTLALEDDKQEKENEVDN